MKDNLIKNIEKKYGFRVLEEYKNKYDEEFITCLDVEDGEKFTVRVLPGEYMAMTFKRLFGNR